MSMSSSRRTSTASDSSTITRHEASGLRPLAPKSRPIAPRPSVTLTTTSEKQYVQRQGPQACRICFKVECQLSTHRNFGATLMRNDPSATGQFVLNGPANHTVKPRFEASYAFVLAKQYVDRDIAASRVDAFYNLPLRPELNTPDVHGLFHDFFAIESQSNFNITRPPEIVGDLIFSPFFVPAMHDSALCLSILAMAAAIVPARSGKQPKNITSLTLVGETMQQMRQRIESDPHNISDVTIATATFLWLLHAWLQDKEALESHSQNVVTFVKSRGGLEKLGMVGAVAQIVHWTDILSSLISHQPCRFLHVHNPEAYTPTASPINGTFWLLPGNPMSANIDPDMIISGQETRTLIDQLEAYEDGLPNARQYIFLVQKLCFLSTKDSIARARMHRSCTIDECVLEAMSLIRMKCFCAKDNLQVLLMKHAQNLGNALQGVTVSNSSWQTNIDLLIWLLFAVFLEPGDFPGRLWCISILVEATSEKFGSAVDWAPTWMEDLNQTLHTFAWSNLRLNAEFVSICNMLLAARIPPHNGLVVGDTNMHDTHVGNGFA